MQPEPTDLSQKTSLNQNSPDNNLKSQHGLDRSDSHLPRQLRAGEGRSIPRRSASNSSSATSSSTGSDQSLAGPLRGLRKSSPVDRIAEHEKALRYSLRKKDQRPGFAVVQRGRNATTGQVVLADFPNGVLPAPS